MIRNVEESFSARGGVDGNWNGSWSNRDKGISYVEGLLTVTNLGDAVI
ncbi:hypothetical protein [Pyrococcus sp. NA2]|nr:hypothetical protein [Pyrococcus sp. NA2]